MAEKSFSAAPTEDIPRKIRSALLEYDDDKNEDKEEYTYEPIPSDRKQIRLLRLYPGVLRSPQVMCEMFDAEFIEGQILPEVITAGNRTGKKIEYEALSWRWGDEDHSHYTIMIRKNSKMYKKRVSQTLGLALKYIRRTEDRILWIDAICINQKNREERSYQVSMMSLVYTRALQVCVWLGEDDDNSRKAFDFIGNEISHLKEFDQLCKDQKNAHKWRAFLGLMQREWFSRRWVVQEIALAPKARVYCGPDELEWRELAIAVELFVEVETVTHRLSELLRNDAKSNVAPNWFEHISELGASLLVNATASIFREYQRGDDVVGGSQGVDRIFEERQGAGRSVKGPDRRSLLSLEYLVTSLSIFDCGRPHDSVYALIAIARDASPNPPTSVKEKRQQTLIAQVFGDQLEQKPYVLDYNSPYPDVCKEFVQFCIERCAKRDPLQALDVLCRPWAKDWQPSDFSLGKDQKVATAKEGIFTTRKLGSWIVIRTPPAEKPSFLLETGSPNILQMSLKNTPGFGTYPSAANPESTQQRPDTMEHVSSSGPLGPTRLPHEAWIPSDDDADSDHSEDAQSQNVPSIPKLSYIDTRTTEDYWKPKGDGNEDNVRDLILRTFSVPRNAADLAQPKSKAWKPSQESPAQDRWRTVRAMVKDLGDDPTLEAIIAAKTELATIDQETAKDVKTARAKYGSSITSHWTKYQRPKHPSIKKLGLPSWVANIDGAAFEIFPHAGMDMVKMGRRNADPLVGTPQDGHRNYSAGQSKVVDLSTLRFKRRARLGHFSLYLKGFSFDRVATVSQVSQAGAIPASWLDLAGWPEARRPAAMNGNLDDPPTAFWRTLVADRGRNDRNPPYYYARACRETILKGGVRSNAVDTTALIFHERNSIIAEFCRRVQSVIWNRALIKTEKGALGLVSEEVREGDLICILHGCTVPVILRPGNVNYKTENEQKNEQFEDGIEAMKRLVAQMERYRERKLRYSQLTEEEKAEVRKHMKNYNNEHKVKEDRKEKEKEEIKAKEMEHDREEWWGKRDNGSDIEEEDDTSDNEKDEQTNGENAGDTHPSQTGEQKAKAEEETQAQKEAKKKEDDEKTIARHKLRQHKAKVRDPLRHFKFLGQAYIHGMMDGAAVRKKFYSGKPDHIFEIR